MDWINLELNSPLSVQSSLSIFAQKYLRKCEDTYFILQIKHLRIYEDAFAAKIHRNDCTGRRACRKNEFSPIFFSYVCS